MTEGKTAEEIQAQPGRVHIKSQGTGIDTQVTVGGLELRGVTKVTWSVSAANGAECQVELEWLPVDVLGSLLQRVYVVLPDGDPRVPAGFVGIADAENTELLLYKGPPASSIKDTPACLVSRYDRTMAERMTMALNAAKMPTELTETANASTST